MDDLTKRAAKGLAQFIIVLALMLLVPAWTLRFWQAWVYLLLFAGSCAAITAYLAKADRKLLERRMSAGPAAEKEKTQKRIQVFAALAFVGVLVLPGLDHRFGWSNVPPPVTIVGDLLVLAGFLVIFLVFRENSFTSGAIEVDTDQTVVSTGPYGLVRHPMYAGALVMILGTPLALGSWWGLVMTVPFALVLAWRLLDEERFLADRLPGYRAYAAKVRSRLIPGVW